jgi:hypothetical protein
VPETKVRNAATGTLLPHINIYGSLSTPKAAEQRLVKKLVLVFRPPLI